MAGNRGHGEGTIRQLPSGRWSWAVMVGRNDDGTIRYDRLTADTRRDLNRLIDEYRRDRASGTVRRSVTFDRHAHDWYDRYAANLSTGSRSTYPYVLAKLLAYWGTKKLEDIKASDVHDMLAYYCRIGLSASYVAKLRGMMYQIMDAAEADDLIGKNPVRYVRFSLAAHVDDRPPKEAYTAEEIRRMCSMPDGKLRDWVVIAIFSGLRLEEILALKGTDILDGGRAISVARAINMDRGTPTVGKTKNTYSVRTIPLPTCVQDIAARYAVHGASYIWRSPKAADRPINPSAFRKQFRAFCEATKVRTLTPHCCRHTYVTQLRMRGVDVEVVKALVGHTRSGVTERYNHIPGETLRAAVESLTDIWPG